jgi:cytochrome c biogenesis protein CcdA/peroxiredoxin
MPILFIFAFLAGVCTLLDPSIVAILLVILAAGSMKGRGRLSGGFLGFVASFTYFTVSLSSTGLSLSFLRSLAVAFVFLFGFMMFFSKGSQLQETRSKRIWVEGLILGIALGLLWVPFAGPMLKAIQSFAATKSMTMVPAGLAFCYVLGAATPLFFLGWCCKKALQTSPILSAHAGGIRRFFACVTLFVAFSLALHWDSVIQKKIERHVPSLLIEDNQLVQGQLSILQQEIQADTDLPVPKGGSLDLYNMAYPQAPELTGLAHWINSQPLSLQQLRGKVVLLDFWDYTSEDCLRSLSYVKSWYEKYKGNGLVVIGIQATEGSSGGNNLAESVANLGITYPVAHDTNYSVSQEYHNNVWPSLYLIDRSGNIVSSHIGEGGYVEMERDIRELVGLPE